MRSLVKKSVLSVEQGFDSGEVGATLAELVNGGLNEYDLLYIVLFALATIGIFICIQLLIYSIHICVFSISVYGATDIQEGIVVYY